MRWLLLLKDSPKYFKGDNILKIKIEIGGKTIIEIGWMHIIFFGIVLFIGFCLFVAWGLSL
jgi:hypothetical protein